MAIINAYPNEILQVGKKCLIKTTTDNYKQSEKIKSFNIKYKDWTPQVIYFSIKYKNITYELIGELFSNVSNILNSKFELYVDFIITQNATTITLEKKDENTQDIELIAIDDAILERTQSTYQTGENSDKIALAIEDKNKNILSTLSKTGNKYGIATFDISNIVRENIVHNITLKDFFDITQTELLKKITLINSTITGHNFLSKITVFTINTNFESTYEIEQGGILATNSTTREIADTSHEMIYFFTKTNNIILIIKAFDKTGNELQTITKEINALYLKHIYQLTTNWNAIKGFFKNIDINKIDSFNISTDKWSITYKRKKFKNPKEFIFKNKFSAYDNIIFDAKNEERIEIEQETAESDNTLFETRKKVYEKVKQNTGIITSKSKAEHIKDFLSSEEVFLVIDGYMQKVIVNIDEAILKQIDSTEPINIQFEYILENFKTII